MPEPSIREGHVDVLLTNLSEAFIQDAKNFVADKVFPVVPVEHASDLYLKYLRGGFWRDEVAPRPFGGESPIVSFQLDKDTYYCEEQAVSAMLDDRERANATAPYDPERAKVLQLTQMQMVHRDSDWSRAFFKTGVWTGAADQTGESSNPSTNQFLQFDQANSTPIELIDTQKETIAQLTGYTPNVLVMGPKVFRILKNHPEVLDRIKYTQRGLVTEELLASLLGVDRVLVPRAVKNTAREGAADAFSFIHDTKSLLLAYAADAPGLDQVSGGYTFSWSGLLGDAAFQAAVWRGRDERKHSDWFEVRTAYDMKAVATDVGVFFTAAVS